MSNPTTDHISCEMCGENIHHVPTHLKQSHPTTTLAEYRDAYPDAKLTSPKFDAAAADRAKGNKKDETAAQQMMAKVIPFAQPGGSRKEPMHEV